MCLQGGGGNSQDGTMQAAQSLLKKIYLIVKKPLTHHVFVRSGESRSLGDGEKISSQPGLGSSALTEPREAGSSGVVGSSETGRACGFHLHTERRHFLAISYLSRLPSPSHFLFYMLSLDNYFPGFNSQMKP